MDVEKFMKEHGIEDVTGDKEAELEAAINTAAYFTVDSDNKALKFMWWIFRAMMLRELTGDKEYWNIGIYQRMRSLEEYLFPGRNESLTPLEIIRKENKNA